MASLPEIDETELTRSDQLAADRAPPGPSQQQQLRARAGIIVQRFKSWLETGSGFTFTNYCPTALQTPFANRYEAKLNARGYDLSYEGERIVISKQE